MNTEKITLSLWGCYQKIIIITLLLKKALLCHILWFCYHISRSLCISPGFNPFLAAALYRFARTSYIAHIICPPLLTWLAYETHRNRFATPTWPLNEMGLRNGGGGERGGIYFQTLENQLSQVYLLGTRMRKRKTKHLSRRYINEKKRWGRRALGRWAVKRR